MEDIVNNFLDNYAEVDEIIVNSKSYLIDNKNYIYEKRTDYYECVGIYKNDILYITNI